MKSKFYLISGIITLAIMLFISCDQQGVVNNTTTTASTVTQKAINNQYIVVFNQSSNSNELLSSSNFRTTVVSFLNKYGVSESNLVAVYQYVYKGFCAKLTEEQVKQISLDKTVSYLEADQIFTIPNTNVESVNTKSQQDNLLSQTTPWGISIIGGAGNGTTLTHKAWIVDTGINLTHPDLNVNTTLSRTFVTTGNDARSAEDNNGHGTHCSGIIAAKNNTVGVVGVAAGATLVAIKVLDLNGSGYTSNIVSGLDYVASHASAGDVVNMSLGGSASTALDNAVIAVAGHGIYVAVAAGNDGRSATTYSPARVNATNVFTVSAHDQSNRFASWSNYGNPPVDWCAPGVNIYSTYKSSGYATMSGTSMATPHVAGILLLNGGVIHRRGYVTGDKDSSADPLAGK